MKSYILKLLLPIACLVFNFQFAMAQFYIDGDVVLVQKNATLYIEGDFETDKTGSINPKLANWGTLAVEGEVDFHSNTFYNGQGNLCFTGSTTQTLSASFPLKKIDIQNNANVELSGDFNLQGELKLTSGHLVIGNYDLTIDDSVNITGGSSSSYIRINGTGKVISKVGSSPVKLPIGRNPYLPIILDDGGGEDYTVGISEGVYGNPVTQATLQTSNVVGETWTIMSSGAQNNVSVTLQWESSAEETGFVRSAAHLAYWENGSSSWINGSSMSASGSDPYTLTRTVNFTTNQYYFGVGSSGSPLPVDLTYFYVEWAASTPLSQQNASATLSNRTNSTDTERSRSGSGSRDAVLTWQTAMEENNSHFEIERSFDGVDFEQIGRVEGQGTTLETTDYQFFDNSSQLTDHGSRSTVNGEPSTIYYRLKQVDYDGKFAYSETRTLSLTERSQSQNSFSVWPNPNNGTELYLSQIGNYQLFSAHGVLLKSYAQVGEIDVSILVKGTYIIRDNMGAHQVLIRQ